MANAKELAKKVADFIKHNKINTSDHTMDEIVKGYFMAQLEAINTAGAKALAEM